MTESLPVHPLARALRILLLFLLLFSAARALLYMLFRETFLHLAGSEVAFAFLSGLRFDLAIVLTLIGGPLVLMLLPVRFARSARWQKTWGWVTFGILVLVFFLFTGDFILFHQQGKHLGAEITIADHDLGESLELAVTRYTIPVAAMLLALVVLFFYWRRRLRRPVRELRRRRDAIVVFVLAVAVVVAGARGSLNEDRLVMGDAHRGLPAGGGKLVMNGPFMSVHSFAALGRANVHFYPLEEALATVRASLLTSAEKVPDTEYPLFRRRADGGRSRPNVVLIMLEGWPAAAVDSIRVHMGQEPLGLTPAFDALAKEGRLFTNFYATGRRTRNGLGSMLAGMPSIPHLPFIGKGLEDMRLPYLGHMAKREGYATYYFAGSARESQDQYRIAQRAGFDHFVVREDLLGDGRKAWDHDLFDAVARDLAGAPEPFLAFVYTTATHAPYQYPKEWEKHPPDTREGAFRNALMYSDHHLGEYVAAARRQGYFDRTLFFIASDHTQRGMRAEGDPRQEFHVPCLVIGAGAPPGIDEKTGSQVDTIPTVVERAGWGRPHAALGRSLFAPGPGAGAVCTSDDLVLRVEDSGWVLHNLDERIDARALAEGADLDAVERRLKSYVQVAFLLWVKDRLQPDPDRQIR